jgi:hypothetical protein
LVALTGIEWVKRQSTVVLTDTSCSFSVQVRSAEHPFGSPPTGWCDRGVTSCGVTSIVRGLPGRGLEAQCATYRDNRVLVPRSSNGARGRCFRSAGLRAADYETIRSSQIAENSFYRPSFPPAIQAVVAHVEQVSEQVAAPLPFPISSTAEVEQARCRRASEGIQLKRTAVPMISSIQPRAHRGES